MRTYARNTLIALGAGLLAALASLSAVAAMGATVTKIDFEVSANGQADIEACIGEQVTFTDGQFNVVQRTFVSNEGGGLQYLFHRNVLAAVGYGDDTGMKYRATGHLQEIYNEGVTGGWTYTFTLLLNVFAQSGPGQFTAHATVHVTVLPSGEEVAIVELFDIHCR